MATSKADTFWVTEFTSQLEGYEGVTAQCHNCKQTGGSGEREMMILHANADTGEKHRRELVRALHFDVAVDHDLFCCMPIRFVFDPRSCDVFLGRRFFVWGESKEEAAEAEADAEEAEG